MPSRSPQGGVVLDSSAILAVLLSEPGWERVIPVLDGGLLSAVNLAEVLGRMISLGVDTGRAWNRVQNLGCRICPLEEGEARVAAELLTATRPIGLSLGDRACLALARREGATVYTAYRAWAGLSLGIGIVVIR